MRSLREQRGRFHPAEQPWARSLALHSDLNATDAVVSSNQKWERKEARVKVKHSVHSPSHLALANPPLQAVRHGDGPHTAPPGCTVALPGGPVCLCGCVPGRSEERSPHVLGIEAWPEGLPSWGTGAISCHLLAALLAPSTST